MRRIALSLGLLAAVVAAEETRTLAFVDGKTKTLVLLSFDDEGLTIRQAAKEDTVKWEELTPASQYEARKALTPYDDGAARHELATFARARKLYPEALEQLEIALALGGLDEATFDAESKAVTEEEIAHLRANIETLQMAKAEPDVLLDAVKRFKGRYPDHEANALYEPLIKELVGKLAVRAEAAKDAADDAEMSEALARLKKKVDKLQERKQEDLDKAHELMKEGEEAIAKRQVSRVKNSFVEPRGAERYFKKAREHMRDLVKLDKEQLLVSKDELQKEWDAIDRDLITCYLHVARMLMDQRNYKGAVEYVRQVLLYDPIHEEALEMAKTIRENRINFKASDITNARPRISGG